MTDQIDKFLDPDSVTVIGVSRNTHKIGRIIYDQIINNGRIVYGVNTNNFKIGKNYIYRSVLETPKVTDLAIYAIPAKFIPDAITQAAVKGIKNHLIISSGYGETGIKGRDKEIELMNLKEKYKINIQGPNCLGNISTINKFNASFAPMPRRGNIGLILQSGAIGTSFFDWAQKENIGISHFISLGNKIDLGENDYLSYLVRDRNTKAIGLYLENIKSPVEFIKQCHEYSKIKPVIILKPGQTEETKVAISSHTGAMAGIYEAQNAAFKQSNLINADNLENFFYLLSFFSKFHEKHNLTEALVITNAGGPAVITVDELTKNNISLTKITDVFITKMQHVLPQNASLKNPIDILGDADPKRLESLLSVLKPNTFSKLCLLHLTPQENTNLIGMAKTLIKRKFRFKGVFIANIIGGDMADKARFILKNAGILCFDFLDDVIALLNKIKNYFMKKNTRDKSISRYEIADSTMVSMLISKHHTFLPEAEVLKIAEIYNFPMPGTYFINTLEECLKTTNRIGFPVVLKISSPSIIHRNKESGVFLNIQTVRELKNAYEILSNLPGRIILQKMITPDAEFIIGAKRDSEFKYLMMFGSGGIHADYLKDVSFSVLPFFSENTMVRMIKETKISALVQNPLIFTNIFRSLIGLLEDSDNIDEIDLNPVILSGKTLSCVDIKIKGGIKP